MITKHDLDLIGPAVVDPAPAPEPEPEPAPASDDPECEPPPRR